MKEQHLVILTPHYNDYDSLLRLLENLNKHVKQRFKLIVVDDCSIDNTLNESKLFSITKKCEIQILYLKRNVGHQEAISIGLEYISQNFTNDKPNVVIMDCDGEDKPEDINNLINELDSSCDVVVCSRQKRSESLFFKIFYFIYKLIFLFLTGKYIDFGNFCAIKFKSLKKIIHYENLSIHIAGSLIASKLKLKRFPVHRGSRYFGSSKMNFNSLVLHGLRAINIFSDNVMIRLGIFSFFMIIFIFLIAGISFLLKLYGLAPPGWLSYILGLLFIIFIQIVTFTMLFILVSKKSTTHPINRIHLIEYVKK